jgi:hypothetical protein
VAGRWRPEGTTAELEVGRSLVVELPGAELPADEPDEAPKGKRFARADPAPKEKAKAKEAPQPEDDGGRRGVEDLLEKMRVERAALEAAAERLAGEREAAERAATPLDGYDAETMRRVAYGMAAALVLFLALLLALLLCRR